MKHECNKEKEISEIQKDVGIISQKVIAVEKRLFGNGVQGLISKMEEFLKHVYKSEAKEEVRKGFESWSRKKFIAILGLGGILLVFLMQLVVELIKIKMFGG